MRHFETNFPFPRLYPRRGKKEKWRKNKIYIVKNIMASSSKESTNKRYSAFAFTQFSLYTVLLRVHVEETELGMGNTATDSDAIKGDVLREPHSKLENSVGKSQKSIKLVKFMIKSSTSLHKLASRTKLNLKRLEGEWVECSAKEEECSYCQYASKKFLWIRIVLRLAIKCEGRSLC